jgi:hypothetical protein
MESKEHFPHLHSLYDGGEIQEPNIKSGFWGVSRLSQNEKTTLCNSHRLWLIVDERAMKLSHSSPQQIRFVRLRQSLQSPSG